MKENHEELMDLHYCLNDSNKKSLNEYKNIWKENPEKAFKHVLKHLEILMKNYSQVRSSLIQAYIDLDEIQLKFIQNKKDYLEAIERLNKNGVDE